MPERIDTLIQQIARKAKEASIITASLDSQVKRQALEKIAAALWENQAAIVEANTQDLVRAEKDNLNQALLKRLKFDEGKLRAVIAGIEQLVHLDDPVGRTLSCTQLDEGLELYKVTCPIGVLGIIFESRPTHP